MTGRGKYGLFLYLEKRGIFCYNNNIMRIIAGEFGGRPLKTLAGKTTRPTSDKVRGAVFNMIGPYFAGGRVLDLFSGSGGLAIEAVSRGMTEAVMVEKDRRAQAVIAANIRMTQKAERFTLLKLPALQALKQLSGHFDLVFLDPPYAKETIVKTIAALEAKELLAEGAVLVCETEKTVELPETIGKIEMQKQKKYGISKVTVYVK